MSMLIASISLAAGLFAGLTAETRAALPPNPVNQFVDCADAFWAAACGLPEPEPAPPTVRVVEGPGWRCLWHDSGVVECSTVERAARVPVEVLARGVVLPVWSAPAEPVCRPTCIRPR